MQEVKRYNLEIEQLKEELETAKNPKKKKK